MALDFVKDPFGKPFRLRTALLASTALAVATVISAPGPARAQDATWLANPGSADFNTGSNWSSSSVPTGTAYFDATSTAGLAFSTGPTTVGGWTFNAGASNYTFTNNNQLYFNGAGIAVNGGSVTINSNNTLIFFNSSTAGNATVNNSDDLEFFDTSTAGTAAITNNNTLGFVTSSTAGSATITNNSDLGFYDSTTAGSATITNSHSVTFHGNSTAGSAQLINNGASAVFDFSGSTGPNGDNKLSAGSIAGDGTFKLGANELTVGSNNLSTEVSGVISGSGSLVKTGTGTLILTGANTYTGGTTIDGYGAGNASTLWLGNTSGAVGSILGTVTVGTWGMLDFVNADTSGITTVTNNGWIVFYNSTSAGSATITNNNVLMFSNTSTAGNATITNNGSLYIYSTAGSAAITNNYNATLTFDSRGTAGSATITNNGNLNFSFAATAGSATITSSNSSNAIFVYFNNNSTAGSASITNGNNSYLNFFDNSTAGSANFTNNSYMYFKNSSSADNATIDNTNGTTFFYNNSTAANATITNNAGGTNYFYENSSAGNAQLINNAANAVFDFSYGTGPNGDNKLSAGSIAGNGTFSLGANALTVGSNNLSTTVSGVIADGGANGGTGASLVKTGTGTLTLTGTNTYTGGTTFAGGTVSVSSDANLGDAAGGLTFNGGALRVTGTAFTSTARAITWGAGGGTFDIASAGNTFTVSQALTGTGGLIKAGAGTLTLSGTHTYTGATTVSAGILDIQGSIASSTITNNASLGYSSNATAGSASITNNSFLDFWNTATAGSATITNGYILNFNGASTAGGASIVNDAYVYFKQTSTAGNAGITNNSLGRIEFRNSSNAGNATIANAGVVDFSGTAGQNNDNRISAGSIAGSGTFYLGANELTVGRDNQSTVVSGTVADGGTFGGAGGALTKTGTGTLTLSGTNTYTGATTVDHGTLLVNGSIASSPLVLVNPGATLGGTGTVATTFLDSGATLAPGTPGSIGTLTVQGNLTFCNCSIYAVKVSPTGADKTVVTGQAALGGTVQATALTGSFRGQTYTILNATGGLGGTQFDSLTFTGSSISPGARNPHLTYDADNVYLVLDPGTLQLSSGASGNQSSVAGGINNAVLNGGTPPSGFDTLLNLSGSQQTNALNQLSGQPGAAITQSAFDAMRQFMTMLGGSADSGEGGVTSFADEALGYASAGKRNAKESEAYAAVTPRDRRAVSFERRWGVWASGYGGSSTINGSTSSGTSTTTSRVYGTVVGADYRATPDTLIGFALGGAGYNFSLSDGLGSGKADLFQAGLYGRHSFGAAYVAASLAYGWQDVTTDRTVTVSGVDKLTANYKASTFAARGETGWRFAPLPASGIGVTPYAALQVTSFRLPGYSETATSGSNTFALSYNAQTTTNVRTELGSHLDRPFLVRDGLFAVRGRVAWAHDSNTDRPVTATFQTLPGSTFTTNGAKPAADAALISAGAKMDWLNGFSLAGTFEGEFSATTRSYAGKATLHYAW